MRIKSDAFFHQIVSEWTLVMITVTQMKQKCSETAALLVFWGSFSAGKTHLFHCLCKMIPATFWRISMVTHSSQKDPSCTAHSSLEKGLISCLFRRIVWNEWQTGDVWHVILSPWHPHPKNKSFICFYEDYRTEMLDLRLLQNRRMIQPVLSPSLVQESVNRLETVFSLSL